jgi:hypothetical protein
MRGGLTDDIEARVGERVRKEIGRARRERKKKGQLKY